MICANKFDCHSPVPVQKLVQVQGSTSKEYGEDVGGAISSNWECDRQEKRREQSTCSHAWHCRDHSCECGLISNTEFCVTAAENEVSPSTAWRMLQTDLCMYLYKIYVFQSLTTVCREKQTRFVEEFGDHLQQNPHTLEHSCFSDEAYFPLTGDKTDKTCVSGALGIHVKFTNPLCMPRKSWCGVRFPRSALLGLSCLRITSLGRTTPWCSTASSLNWDRDDVLFMHSGSNRMKLELTPHQRSWNSCTPSSSIA
jgi:hypothetical protein